MSLITRKRMEDSEETALYALDCGALAGDSGRLPRLAEFQNHMLFRELAIEVDSVNEPYAAPTSSGHCRSQVEVLKGCHKLPARFARRWRPNFVLFRTFHRSA